jgi:hypothetical protein
MLNSVQCVLVGSFVVGACQSKVPKPDEPVRAAADHAALVNDAGLSEPADLSINALHEQPKPTALDASCKWMDIWHPSFKRIRKTARKYLERSEATDVPPQMLCCRVAPGHALCKVWRTWHFSEVYSANNVIVQMGSSERLVGVTEGESEAWLDTNLMVANHRQMGEADTPFLHLEVTLRSDAVSLSAPASSCPRPCGRHCYLIERLARDTCESLGTYQLFGTRWQKQ